MFSWFSYLIWGDDTQHTTITTITPKIPDSNTSLDTLRVGDYDEKIVKMRESLRKSTN